jgi:hypothetical protein
MQCFKFITIQYSEELLTWHNDAIPSQEIWIKIGGDKGGGSFKMNFQIANLLHPNSSHTTCVFSCYEADDTITNFHVALDRFRSEVNNMGTAQWK